MTNNKIRMTDNNFVISPMIRQTFKQMEHNRPYVSWYMVIFYLEIRVLHLAFTMSCLWEQRYD